MEIKVSRQPQPKRVQKCDFQALKKQCLKDRKQDNPSDFSVRSAKNPQYIQVNYLKDFVYKVSPQVHSKVPLLRQQQNFRDYLLEIQTGEQKLHEMNNQIKYKYFIKNKTSTTSRKTQRNEQQITTSQNNFAKYAHENDIYLFDPIEYLEEKNKKRQRKLLNKTKKLNQIHSFADEIQSVKYLSQAPEIKLPKTLPLLNKDSSDSFFSRQKIRQNTHHQINDSINEILQKSIKFHSQSKINPKKLRSYKSRSQIQRDTENKIQTQRKSIIKMVRNSQKNKSLQKTHKNPNLSVNQISAKQKYAIDFISYVRTKTKDQLDKYAYERLIKQPQKDLEKFQQFMLKQVKFQNEQNKHKIQRFFIKMREQFRRVEKYNKKGQSFDWRSKSMHLDEINKQDTKMQKSKFLQQKLLKNSPNQTFLSSKSNTKFIENLQGKRIKSKVDRIMTQYILMRNQKLKQQLQQLQVNPNNDGQKSENQEVTS